MRRRKEVKGTFGFEGRPMEVKVEIEPDRPRPWDLSTKLSVAGTAVPRVDGPAKTTGRAKYTFDVSLPGMLHGAVLRSPHPHAKVVSIDASAARAMPGVRAVKTYEGKTVKFAGDEVAAVAAATPEVAEDALETIRVKVETRPFVATIDEAMAEGAPRVHAKRQNVDTSGPHGDGDVEKGFAEAEIVLEATYRTQVQTHAPLETHGFVAKWEGEELTVWASTQGTFSVREDLASHFRIPASKVRVIAEHVGGGFGSKFGAGFWGVCAAELAREAGAPVKLMLDRKGEHLAAGNRPDSIQKMKVGARKDGTITAWEVRTWGTAGIGGGAGVANPMIYDLGVTRKWEADVYTHAGPGCAMRAPGHPQGSFALEGMLDEVAAAIRKDPLELRTRIDGHPARREQWRIGAERIGWHRRGVLNEGAGRVRRGLGCAASTWGNAGDTGVQVGVAIHPDGSVEVRNGCQDIGTGTRTLMAVIAAEELGVEPARIAVRLGDTSLGVGPASGGSTTAPSVGPAVREGAFRAKRALFEKAASRLGARPEGLESRGGRVFVRDDPSKGISWKEACATLGATPIEVTGERRKNFDGWRGDNAGCQFAEVEVDTATGVARVLKVVAIQDAGTVIDRLTFESQVIGGVIQGLSFALFEERVMDRRFGVMLNPNLDAYKIAGSLDMPEIEAIPFEIRPGLNDCGILGLGEPPVIPTAAAIGNAVSHAIGGRIRELPITPARVLAALSSPSSPEGGR
ncbi:MAG: xanthine dehydrogenase family protein molybdopterin-binding subunit [Planctomycetes bacterium]|nr:xanthine dehydrogenase family protein molybdopterin-binding subunit [Planctomycetota bacterium]